MFTNFRSPAIFISYQRANVKLIYIRLPLRLVDNVTYNEYKERCEIASAGRCWEFEDGAVIIYELPKGP